MALRELVGAISIGGRVYRRGTERELARAARDHGIDLGAARFARLFGKEIEGEPEPESTVTVSPPQKKKAKGPQSDEEVRALYSVKDAPTYLARVSDPAEVMRLMDLDGRSSARVHYETRLADLSE